MKFKKINENFDLNDTNFQLFENKQEELFEQYLSTDVNDIQEIDNAFLMNHSDAIEIEKALQDIDKYRGRRIIRIYYIPSLDKFVRIESGDL